MLLAQIRLARLRLFEFLDRSEVDRTESFDAAHRGRELFFPVRQCRFRIQTLEKYRALEAGFGNLIFEAFAMRAQVFELQARLLQLLDRTVLVGLGRTRRLDRRDRKSTRLNSSQ